MKIKVDKDGFIWLVLNEKNAIAIYRHGSEQLYVLMNDDSEKEVESELDIILAIQNGCAIGIEVGFIDELLPSCPKCGCTMNPSEFDDYTFKCLSCGKKI